MKSLIIFAILFVGAIATGDDCSAEFIRIREAIVGHVNDDTFDYRQIMGQLKKLHAEEITEEDFGKFVDGFCPKALDSIHFGLDQIPTISEECANELPLVITKNMLKIFKAVFGILCTESGKGYKAVVKNNGTNCYFGNNDYTECFKTHNTEFFNEEILKPENVCNFVKVHVECENFLDKCDNHDVKPLQHEINARLKEEMHCTFD